MDLVDTARFEVVLAVDRWERIVVTDIDLWGTDLTVRANLSMELSRHASSEGTTSLASGGNLVDKSRKLGDKSITRARRSTYVQLAL